MKSALCLAFLMILIACTLHSANGSAGLGISHYDVKSQVGLNKVYTVAVAQVSNTGNETLNLTCIWSQETGSIELFVTVNDRRCMLEPGASKEIMLNVIAPNDTYIGNYTGNVEISARLTHSVSGNPNIPGGTVKVNIMVKKVGEASNPPSSLDLLYSVVFVGLIMTIATCCCAKKYSKSGCPLNEA